MPNYMKKIFLLILLLISISGISQEICNNGIDDDSDGLIDLQDTVDCKCTIASSNIAPLSLIPNPSFEQRSCCPTTTSQLNCANSWVQASMATSDYFNTCGSFRKITVSSFSFPPSPIPSGNGYVGFYNGTTSPSYKEYVGICLLDTMHTGISYQIQFYMAHSKGSMSTGIEIFGTNNCSNLPFGGTNYYFGCPTNGPNWVALDSAIVTFSTTAWTQVTLTFTPTIDITAIVLGPSCSAPAAGSNYYFLDSLILNSSSSFSPVAKITDTGHYCKNNLILYANYDSLPKGYQWYKDSIALVNDTNPSYSIPQGGIGKYQVRLLYDSGCILTPIHLVDTPVINFKYDSLGSCLSTNPTGKISIHNINGGQAPYTFKEGINSFKTDSTFSNLLPGNYTITIQDSNTCSEKIIINIPEFPKPIANFVSDTICYGVPTTFTDKSIIPKGTIIEWDWSSPILSTTQNTVYTFPSVGSFPINLTVKSDSGCIDDTTIMVIVNPLPVPDFDFSPKETFTFDTKICFTNSSIGATYYYWDFNFSGINGTSTVISPCNVIFPNDKEFTYKVKLYATNQFGCLDSISKDIIILNEFILYVPNSFTPNGDNLNDILYVKSEGIETFEWIIFNRWGEQIFKTTDLTKGWNGKHNGKLVPVGEYVYKIIIVSENGETKELIGHINVVR